MNTRITQSLQPLIVRAAETDARLKFLRFAGAPTALGGQVEGPFCAWARTLPTRYFINPSTFEADIVDPCYWTPKLPFLYNLELEADFGGGTSDTQTARLGLRRWEVAGPHLRLERKRIVLRGMVAAAGEEPPLLAARESEVALIVRAPGDGLCQEASRLGVPLIVDLRGSTTDWAVALRRLAWHPSAMIVLVDEDAPEELDSVGLPLVAANVVRCSDGPDKPATPCWVAATVVELLPGERPPPWLVDAERPIIAVRQHAGCRSLQDARAACDLLQAELAPQFNLAGYFVGP